MAVPHRRWLLFLLLWPKHQSIDPVPRLRRNGFRSALRSGHWAASCMTCDIPRSEWARTPACTTLHSVLGVLNTPGRQPSRIPHPLRRERSIPLQDMPLADGPASACSRITRLLLLSIDSSISAFPARPASLPGLPPCLRARLRDMPWVECSNGVPLQYFQNALQAVNASRPYVSSHSRLSSCTVT
jgi:hypothetical protein